MAEEKIITVPLRAALRKAGRTYKATRAVHEIRRFVGVQTAAEVRLSPAVNEALWARSRERPPGRIRVKVEESGMVRLPEEKVVPPQEKGKLEGLKGKLVGAVKEELGGGKVTSVKQEHALPDTEKAKAGEQKPHGK